MRERQTKIKVESWRKIEGAEIYVACFYNLHKWYFSFSLMSMKWNVHRYAMCVCVWKLMKEVANKTRRAKINLYHKAAAAATEICLMSSHFFLLSMWLSRVVFVVAVDTWFDFKHTCVFIEVKIHVTGSLLYFARAKKPIQIPRKINFYAVQF